MFTPITEVGALPATGTNVERFFIDLKAQSDPARRFENAKDVASFANSAGGTLVIGAIEGTDGVFERFNPLTAAVANAIKDGFTIAVRDRCSPVPFIDALVLDAPGGGGSVVVINAFPLPSSVVSVGIRGDSGDGYGGIAYVFPVRVGAHTRYVTSEQAASVLTQNRAIRILLDSIPANERGAILILLQGGRYEATIHEVRPLENRAIFEIRAPNAVIMNGKRCSVPLDYISSVWRNSTRWFVRAEGTIVNPGQGENELPFLPGD